MPDNSDLPTDAASNFFSRMGESYDISKISSLIATYESAQYVIERMQSARPFRDIAPIREYCVAERCAGLIVELGVASGGSLSHLQQLSGQTVYGFDSFNGLPEHWRPGFERGAFAQNDKVIVPGAEIYIGLFEETLPQFMKEHHDAHIGLLHVDCDLYSSTKTAFDVLGPLIKPGTVILFDEYFNYPGWKLHEHKALLEFCAEYGVDYDYVAYVETIQQAAIRIVKKTGKRSRSTNWLQRLFKGPK